MSELWPILAVVAFWIITGVIACWFFGRALRLPTESELEVAHELAAASEHAQPAAAH
jgi:Kef-type K+ transport system membrane component KefB